MEAKLINMISSLSNLDSDDVKKSIGMRIKAWVESSGDTMTEACTKMNFSYDSFQKITTGVYSASNKLLIGLNLVYKADLNWILTGVESPTKGKTESEFFINHNLLINAYQKRLEELNLKIIDLESELSKKNGI